MRPGGMRVRPRAGHRRRLVGLVRGFPRHGAIAAVCLLWSLPALGLLISSLRPPRLVSMTGWWTALFPPFHFTLENYLQVLNAYGMTQSFLNSLMITIPLQMTLIPVLRLFTRLDLTGTFPAAWLAHTAYGLPFAIYLLRNFISALPRDLMEAASMDGAGPLAVFFRLILPLSMPSIASLAIFQFLWVWNDLLVTLIYVGGTPDVATVTVTVSSLVNSLGQNWQLLTAAAFVSMALPMLVFVILQRYFVRGILAGAVRG